MSERPILMNTDMVRAILEGRKTVTRRVIKPQPVLDGHFWRLGGAGWGDNISSFHPVPCHSLYNRAPYHPGDTLWVRETWCESLGQAGKYFYRAYAGPRDEMKEYAHSFNKWRPSIHMPREAARIFLRVTGVRVERLQELTLKDAEMEGIDPREPMFTKFVEIWNNTVQRHPNKFKRYPYYWEDNPWVWVISFERISGEEVQHAT